MYSYVVAEIEYMLWKNHFPQEDFMSRMVTLLIALTPFIATPAAFGAIIHVPGDSATIQAGINGAVNGDTILVADGTYTGGGNRDIDFGGKLVVVKSENGPELCIIDSEGDSLNYHRGFYFHSGEDFKAVVEGFTVRGGYIGPDTKYPQGKGGGIRCDSSSSPTFKNNLIDGNYATLGGGIYCSGSSNPRISDNTIRGNLGFECGGGIYCNSSNPIIENNCISGNSTNSYGAGIYCAESDAVIIDNTINMNTAYLRGGGIYCAAFNPKIIGNVISGNSANWCGGINCQFSDATIIGNIVIDNSAIFVGGIFCDYASPIISNNTIVGNSSAEHFASGVYCAGWSFPTLDNCIISFNRSSEVPAVGCFTPATFTVTCCNIYGNDVGDWVGCIADQEGINGNFSLDPFFCDTALGDYHISSSSPCTPAYSSCGVLIGALGISCATEPIALIDPDTMYVFQAHTIDTMTAIIYFGDLTDGHTVADINPPTILINGIISPTSWTLLPSHPDFHSEVMEITFPIRDFILGYMPLWDTTIQMYTISGEFDDDSSLSVNGEVTMIGHTSGDVNGDGRVNVADLTYLVDFLFNGGPEPPVMETADIDNNGGVNVADVTELVRFLFG